MLWFHIYMCVCWDYSPQHNHTDKWDDSPVQGRQTQSGSHCPCSQKFSRNTPQSDHRPQDSWGRWWIQLEQSVYLHSLKYYINLHQFFLRIINDYDILEFNILRDICFMAVMTIMESGKYIIELLLSVEKNYMRNAVLQWATNYKYGSNLWIIITMKSSINFMFLWCDAWKLE
jgi:hypothetical protein